MIGPRTSVKNALAAVLGTVLFVLFYLKYVPLVPGFQALVLASGLAVALLAATRPEAGLLAFLFAFPLVGWWPYLFGMDERVPHAPGALVLFLFLALGWLVRRARRPSAGAPPSALRPAILYFSAVTTVSAATAFWRFAGFVPFAADRLYEFAVNTNGVSAGGARMSVVFSALNLLTGPGLFLLARPHLGQARFRSRAAAAFASGLAVASAAGLVQRFADPHLGNTEFWARMGQINGTFMDPNAFATVLSLALPLLLAAALRSRGRVRALFGAAAVLGLAAFPFIGARSPLLGLAAALLWLAFAAVREWRRAGGALGRTAAVLLLAGAVVLAGLGGVLAGRSRLYQRMARSVAALSGPGGIFNLSKERYFLWKEAAAMTADHPVSGVGVGAYIVELPNYYSLDRDPAPAGLEGYRRNDSAESLPLQIGAELGLAGLAGLIWLAAALARLSRRVRRDASAGADSISPERLLRVAASAGLLSFGFNSLFHSYIGSFETIYALWFLAAYLAGAEPAAAAETKPPSSEDGGPGIPRRRFPASAAAGLLLFAAASAWDAGHSLAPGRRFAAYPIPREFGLFPPEKTTDGREYRWTREYGAVPVPAGSGRVRVSLHIAHPDAAARPVDVEFTLVEGFFRSRVRLGGVRIRDGGWRTVEYALPPGTSPDALLLVNVSRTWVPFESNGAADRRRLGAALGTPVFTPR